MIATTSMSYSCQTCIPDFIERDGMALDSFKVASLIDLPNVRVVWTPVPNAVDLFSLTVQGPLSWARTRSDPMSLRGCVLGEGLNGNYE